MAMPIYAPISTAISLGNYVRATRTSLEVFKAGHLPDPNTFSMGSSDSEPPLRSPLSKQVSTSSLRTPPPRNAPRHLPSKSTPTLHCPPSLIAESTPYLTP
ncbi:hypothetical protein BGW80DRAFT_1408792 [Lactifluus volemus]|nr:hypothetical protein BGW80DRAFT_1408792 [Lactifluus volemus]